MTTPDLTQNYQKLTRAVSECAREAKNPVAMLAVTKTWPASTVRACAALGQRASLPVHLVDERYSSLEAHEQLRERRASGARRARISRESIDSAAAAVILGFLILRKVNDDSSSTSTPVVATTTTIAGAVTMTSLVLIPSRQAPAAPAYQNFALPESAPRITQYRVNK